MGYDLIVKSSYKGQTGRSLFELVDWDNSARLSQLGQHLEQHPDVRAAFAAARGKGEKERARYGAALRICLGELILAPRDRVVLVSG